MIDPDMKKFLADVVGVVEANSFESMVLWSENRQRAVPRTWEQKRGGGYIPTIGKLDNRPVTLSLLINIIGGQEILFIDSPSQVTDHKMIENWLKAHLPSTAFRQGGYIKQTNAMNFHVLFND